MIYFSENKPQNCQHESMNNGSVCYHEVHPLIKFVANTNNEIY